MAMSARKKKILLIKIIVFAVLAAAYAVSVIFFNQAINRALNFYSGVEAPAAVEGLTPIQVHYIDVGQGDSTVIEFPDDKTMIIDGGPRGSTQKLLDYLENTLTHIEGFDYVMLTHSDEDHCGGLDDVLNKYPMKSGGRIYRPNQKSVYSDFTDGAASKTGKEGFWGAKAGEVTTKVYYEFISAAYAQADGVEVWVTDATPSPSTPITNLTLNTEMDFYGDVNGNGSFDAGDYAVRFYGPTVSYYSDVNDYSPIITVDYMGASGVSSRALFSGDAEEKAEADFCAAIEAGAFAENFDIKANIIKLGHHGSKTSNSDAYLAHVLPADASEVLAVASSNKNGNKYNHPSPETLTRLKGLGFTDENILITEKLGSLYVTLTAEGVTYGELTFVLKTPVLQWASIGGAALVVIFVLLFLVRITKKGMKVKGTAVTKGGTYSASEVLSGEPVKRASSSGSSSSKSSTKKSTSSSSKNTKTTAAKKPASGKTAAAKKPAAKTSASKSAASKPKSDLEKQVDEIKRLLK